MINILIVVPRLTGGGAERVAILQANYWARQGNNVVLVSWSAATQDDYIVDKGVFTSICDMSAMYNRPFGAVVAYFYQIFYIRKIINNIDAEVCIGHLLKNGVAVTISCLFSGCRSVVVEHSHPKHHPAQRSFFWSRARKYIYQLAGCVVALTESQGEWIRVNTKARRILVIPNAIERPLVSFGEYVNPALCQAEILLLAVGRLTDVKGFDRLLNVIALLRIEFPTIRLAIVGEGEKKNELIIQSKKLGLERCVCFIGAVSNLAEWYSVADIYVMSSRFEGFGLTLVEAMAEGAAVVSVDCESGPADIIDNGRNGLLCPNSEDGLLHGLRELLSSDEKREMFKLAAPSIIDQFSVEAIMEKWKVVLEVDCEEFDLHR